MNGTGDEWWQNPGGGTSVVEPRKETPLEPEVHVVPDSEKPDSAEEVIDEKSKKPDRRRSIIIGAAGAALAGIVLLTAMPDDTSTPPPGVTTTMAPDTFLPPAGGNPRESTEDPIAAGPTGEEAMAVANIVTLTAKSAGQGETGALMNVVIRNDTDSTITVMSSMMRGDNRSAMVGEGTLAPGARTVEPGETAEGTIEFSTKKPPSQIVLLDLSGGVVAAN